MIFVFRKTTYYSIGTKKTPKRCPNCNESERFRKVIDGRNTNGYFVYHCLECDEFYPENLNEPIYKWKHWYIRKRKLNTEENMSGKSSFKVGQSVICDGTGGYSIVKLMNLSAKVEDEDGNTKILPYSLIEPEGGSGKKASGKAKTKKKEEKPKSKPKTSSKSKAGKKKAYVASDEDQDEDIDDNNDKPPAPPKFKKRKQSVNDEVSELLAEAGTETKMVTAVKKHEAYPHINKESFKRTVGLKGQIGLGLFKMRLANLLRGAIKRSLQ